MKYEVKDAISGIRSKHRSKAAAIKAAKAEAAALGVDDRIAVIAHEISGTYESRQQVWPTVGRCYSN